MALPVYCLAGMAYQYKVKQASGSDLIPNKAFWVGLPGLVMDGCKFTYAKISGKDTGYSQI